MRAGQTLIDLSSIAPDATSRMATRLQQETGAQWVDAPVSGGLPAARAGRLIVFAGGNAAALGAVRSLLAGEPMSYMVPPDDHNRHGKATGLLVGGNLSMIVSCMGTRSEIQTKGRILFLEEVGEYLYSLDRMFVNLERAGKLQDLSGLIIGGFNRIKPDDPGEEFGRTLYDIIFEKTKRYKYPVCFQFPVGHQKNNFALKCGAMHQLTVDASGSMLKEWRKA